MKDMKEMIKLSWGCSASFDDIKKRTIENALNKIRTIVAEGNEYVFDITGGNEIFITAAGMFVAENKHLPLRIQQYDVKSGKLLVIYPKTATLPQSQTSTKFNIKQVLALNGSAPAQIKQQPFSYGALARDTINLWYTIRGHLKKWNDFFSSSSEKDAPSHIQKRVIADPRKKRTYDSIAAVLKKSGILTDEIITKKNDVFHVQFRLNVSEAALQLYKKSGNLLEIYTAMAAYEVGLFHDICVGVELDWNGIDTKEQQQPTNEIDVVLLKENLPIFISCKNTKPENEYLYEIMIMAKHYGGHYATPALFSSYPASSTVRQRAEEMGVILIENLQEKSFDEFKKEIKMKFS
jgi:hypothetical protein